MIHLFIGLLLFVETCFGQASGGAGYHQASRIKLEPWTLSDWDGVTRTFAPNVNFLMKDYIYDSVLALDTNLFDEESYKLPILTTNWGSVSSPIPDVGIIGKFNYDEDWENWGGDTLHGIGPLKYALTMADFGHNHILNVHARNLVLMQNPLADLTNLDLTLARLSGGSSFIFAKFALLVDRNGNFLSTVGDSPATIQIKGLLKHFIFGNGDPYGSPGSTLNMNSLSDFLVSAINNYGQNPAHRVLLGEIAQRMQNKLVILLDLMSSDPIPLVAWDPLMRAHQAHTTHGYEMYRDAYFPASKGQMANATASIATMYKNADRFGRQMAAFFVAFYGMVDFLDKMILVDENIMGDEYAIRMDVHVERSLKIYELSSVGWFEHVLMFEDHNKACAVQNQKKMFETRAAMLESCTKLAAMLGECMRAFDTLIRHRGLYERL